jgi:hypothetical protein
MCSMPDPPSNPRVTRSIRPGLLLLALCSIVLANCGDDVVGWGEMNPGKPYRITYRCTVTGNVRVDSLAFPSHYTWGGFRGPKELVCVKIRPTSSNWDTTLTVLGSSLVGFDAWGRHAGGGEATLTVVVKGCEHQFCPGDIAARVESSTGYLDAVQRPSCWVRIRVHQPGLPCPYWPQ